MSSGLARFYDKRHLPSLSQLDWQNRGNHPAARYQFTVYLAKVVVLFLFLVYSIELGRLHVPEGFQASSATYLSMDELEELPASRQGPFGCEQPKIKLFKRQCSLAVDEFPGDQPPPQASGPPLLNPSEDRVLDNFIHGVGSDQGWLDDQLLVSVDDPKSGDSTYNTRPPMPPPVQHIMTSLPAPSTQCSVPAHQIFQEPLGLSNVALRDATTFVVPTSFSYADNLPHQVMPRDPGSTFLDMNDFHQQPIVTGPNQFYIHPVFGAMTYTMCVEYLHSAPRLGPDCQDTWPRHEYPDPLSDPILGSTHPNLNQSCVRENLVQFGSDLRFARDHFEAPDQDQNEARLRATMLGQVRGLFTKGSVVGESRPSSPDIDGADPRSPVVRMDIIKSAAQAPESEGCRFPLQGSSMSSMTKVKGTATKKVNGAVFSPTVKTVTRSRKNKGKRHTNLSNEQRVDNHRQSEQRRRDEIRNSYVAMKATIPGMGDKKTKGAEMQYTVTWLRQTLKENEILSDLLESVTKGS